MVTKGYGFTVDDIDWSSPADLEPYANAYKLQMQQQDYLAWISNQYTLSAVSVAIEHNLAGRKARSKYIEKPILEFVRKSNELTEGEKQREVDLFFARENARRINWKRNHKKNNEE